ncbi:Tyrosine recombinase XerD [Rickettsiales bacterium Ac37b]|nr:Tyrosine recombinase XerD [Rickettsiales bacterium Ac37b]
MLLRKFKISLYLLQFIDIMNHHHLELFLEMLITERAATQNTISSYSNDLSSFFSFLALHNKNCLQCDIATLRHYISSLSSYNKSTILRKISTLKQFYKFLYSEQLIFSNPALLLDSPRKGRSLPKVLSVKEIELLINISKLDLSSEGTRLTAMLETLYATGLRVSELISLKLNNLQFFSSSSSQIAEQTIIVNGKGNKERLTIINNNAAMAINNYLNIRHKFIPNINKFNNYLFPSNSKTGYITRQRFGQLIKQLALQANMDPKRVSPHVLRHSFASHILEQGADLRFIQELLGHADISSTQIYTHIQPNKLKSTVEKLLPLIISSKHKKTPA